MSEQAEVAIAENIETKVSDKKRYKLSKFNSINERLQQEKQTTLPDFLNNEYTNLGRSIWDISLDLGISSSTVRNYLEDLNIPRRQGSEARVENRQNKD